MIGSRFLPHDKGLLVEVKTHDGGVIIYGSIEQATEHVVVVKDFSTEATLSFHQNGIASNHVIFREHRDDPPYTIVTLKPSYFAMEHVHQPPDSHPPRMTQDEFDRELAALQDIQKRVPWSDPRKREAYDKIRELVKAWKGVDIGEME